MRIASFKRQLCQLQGVWFSYCDAEPSRRLTAPIRSEPFGPLARSAAILLWQCLQEIRSTFAVRNSAKRVQ